MFSCVYLIAVIMCGYSYRQVLTAKIAVGTYADIDTVKVNTTMSTVKDHANANSKTIIFVRHGESHGNVAKESGQENVHDASLTPKGEQQARAAVKVLASRLAVANALTNPSEDAGWLLASSPLTRAIQTAETVWPKEVALGRRAIAAELREYLVDLDDVGSPRSKLELEWPNLAQAIDEADLEEVWWSSNESSGAFTPGADGLKRSEDGSVTVVSQERADARIDAAIDWLARQPETKVVVVAHAGLFLSLLDRLGLGKWGFPNAGVFLANDVNLGKH